MRNEKRDAQPILVNAEIDVLLDDPKDEYANVVGYDTAARRIEAIVAQGHVNLVETWAERIAAALLEDPRAQRVKVKNREELKAVAKTASVGVEIERSR